MTGLDVTRRRLIRISAGLSLALLSRSARTQTASPFGHGQPAAVSLTYDDGLTSQLDHALPQLDARGLRATFFLTADNMDGQWDRWRAAAATGHEMANHTVSHPCDLRRETPVSFAGRELGPMEELIRSRLEVTPARIYAYPCDDTELGSGRRADRQARYGDLVSRTFRAARTTDGPPNRPDTVMANRFFLHGFEPTEHADTPDATRNYLDLAVRQGGWAILIFHEVVPHWRATGDVGVATHARILDEIQLRPLWCAPVGSVLQQLAGL